MNNELKLNNGMSDALKLLPAIDILMSHTGASFQDACEQLGVDPVELRQQQLAAKNLDTL